MRMTLGSEEQEWRPLAEPLFAGYPSGALEGVLANLPSKKYITGMVLSNSLILSDVSFP